MNDPVYLMRLAGDLYLDNEGVLHKRALPPSRSYTLPGGFLLSVEEASKIAKTLNDIGGALPDETDKDRYPEFERKLKEYGVVPEFIKILGVVGKVAETFGSIFVV